MIQMFLLGSFEPLINFSSKYIEIEFNPNMIRSLNLIV
jgi:hypothetical protein